jgi:hypothetical protein
MPETIPPPGLRGDYRGRAYFALAGRRRSLSPTTRWSPGTYPGESATGLSAPVVIMPPFVAGLIPNIPFVDLE